MEERRDAVTLLVKQRGGDLNLTRQIEEKEIDKVSESSLDHVKRTTP